MSASNAFTTAIETMLLTNTGDSAGLFAAGSLATLYVALHTASPGVAGNQSTSEATYTGYARVAITRTSGNWTISAGSYSNAAAVTFAACTAGSSTVTYFSIGTASTGAGEIMLFGSLAASVTIVSPDVPSFAVGALTGTVA